MSTTVACTRLQKNMSTTVARTRLQKKAKEQSKKYKPTFLGTKGKEQLVTAKNKQSKPKRKVPASTNEREEQPDNAKKQATVHNEEDEQPLDDIPSDPNEGLRSENKTHPEQTADAELEIGKQSEAEIGSTSRKRGGRGPAKAKRLPSCSQDRIEVEFNDLGIPIGRGSVYLSSFLGPLVREQVPYSIDDWRSISDDLTEVLWHSVQVRFKLEEEWQRKAIFQQMGVLWRSSKSKLVRNLQKAENEEERLKLKPTNMKSMNDWRKFVKVKTSPEFKQKSQKYSALRSTQLPHTTGRRGMARKTEDMKKESVDPSSITRADVWIRSNIKKNGEPVNIEAANTIEKIKKYNSLSQSGSTQTDLGKDALVHVLGQDKPGRLRALGRGCILSKLAVAQCKDKQLSRCREEIAELKGMIQTLMDQKGKESLQGSTHEMGKESSKRSSPDLSYDEVCLLNWDGTSGDVAHGRLLSMDPDDVVNGIRLGPNAGSVVIDLVDKADTYLWRPTPEMTGLADAKNKVVAWPSVCIKVLLRKRLNFSADSASTSSIQDNCKIYGWNEDEGVVAEGRIYATDPKYIVNGIPLGPFAIVIWVDKVVNKDAYLWRPTYDMSCIGDAVGRKVAWPRSKVEAAKEKLNESRDDTENIANSSLKSIANSTLKSAHMFMNKSQHPIATMQKDAKCKLIDLGGTDVVVEGTIASTDPITMVHCRMLGLNAVKVWIELVIVPNAEIWRPTSALTCMEDCFGTPIAWPMEKIIINTK